MSKHRFGNVLFEEKDYRFGPVVDLIAQTIDPDWPDDKIFAYVDAKCYEIGIECSITCNGEPHQFGSIYFCPKYIEDMAVGNLVAKTVDTSMSPGEIMLYIHEECEKIGIKYDLYILEDKDRFLNLSKTMRELRHGRAIYGLLAIQYGKVQEGIDLINSARVSDIVEIDEKNRLIMIKDGNAIIKYGFGEKIFEDL